MMHTKTAAMNLYQKEALKPIQQQYSPNYKRARQSPHIQVVLKSTQLNHAISKVKTQLNKQRLEKRLQQSPLYASQPLSQKRPSLASNSLGRFNSTNLRRESLQSRNHVIRTARQQHEFQYKKDKSAKERLRTQQKQLVRQQIQHKRKELQREKELKIRRQTSERSFVLETHKETVDMIKRSRQVRSRSEIKLVKQKYKETEREHQFLINSKKKAYLQMKQQHRYHETFIKNKSLPKFHYPNLADTLAIASKTLTTNTKPSISKVVNSQTTSKKGLSKQKLQPLNQQPRKKSIVADQVQKQIPERSFITAQEALDNPQVSTLPGNHCSSLGNHQIKNQAPNPQPTPQTNQPLILPPSQNCRNERQQDPKAEE